MTFFRGFTYQNSNFDKNTLVDKSTHFPSTPLMTVDSFSIVGKKRKTKMNRTMKTRKSQ